MQASNACGEIFIKINKDGVWSRRVAATDELTLTGSKGDRDTTQITRL